jgi:hypothetical protein
MNQTGVPGKKNVPYQTGMIAISVGEAYDMGYGVFSSSERQTIRNCIINKALVPLYSDVSNDR